MIVPVGTVVNVRNPLTVKEADTCIAQRKVCFVSQGSDFLIERIKPAELIQDFGCFVDLAAAHQRNAEIELRILGPGVSATPVAQECNCLLVLRVVDQNLGSFSSTSTRCRQAAGAEYAPRVMADPNEEWGRIARMN